MFYRTFVTLLAVTITLSVTASAHAQSSPTIPSQFQDAYDRAIASEQMPENVHITDSEQVQLTGAEIESIDSGTLTVEVHGITFTVDYSNVEHMMSGADTEAKRISVGDDVIINGTYDAQSQEVMARAITSTADRERQIQHIKDRLKRLRQQLQDRTESENMETARISLSS